MTATNVLVLQSIALRVPEVDEFVANLYRGTMGLAGVFLVFRNRGFQSRHLVSRPMVLLRAGSARRRF